MRIHFISVSHSLRRVKRRWAMMSRRQKGVAMVEFALIAPIMFTMYLGMVELSLAFGLDRKNGVVARTLGDLVTQSTNITNADLDNIFNATATLLPPYPVKEISMRITSLRIDSTRKVFVDWSEVKSLARSAGPYAAMGRCANGDTLVPTRLRVPSTTIVVTETKTKHVPVLKQFVGNFDFGDVSYFRPRVSNAVTRDGVPTTLCPGERP